VLAGVVASVLARGSARIANAVTAVAGAVQGSEVGQRGRVFGVEIKRAMRADSVADRDLAATLEVHLDRPVATGSSRKGSYGGCCSAQTSRRWCTFTVNAPANVATASAARAIRSRQIRRDGSCYGLDELSSISLVVGQPRRIQGQGEPLLRQGRQDSNLRHSVLETDALPAELRPYASGGL
jgi:hypothetical protein